MYHARHADDPRQPACALPARPDKILILADELESVTCPGCRRAMQQRPAHYRRTHGWHRRAA